MQQTGSQCLEVAAFVGLDWSDTEHSIGLQASDSREVECSVLQQKAEALHDWVAQLRQRFGGGKVAIALEQSKGAVIYALMGYEFLVLFPINPKALAAYRKAFRVSGAKDDPTDAELLLDLVRSHHDKLRAWIPEDEKTRAIGLLSEQRRKLVDDRTRLTNQLGSALKQYFPQALEWLETLDHRLSWEFLSRWPTLQCVQKATAGQLRKFFSQYRRRDKLAWVEEKIQQIGTAVPLTEDFAVVTANSLVVQAIVDQLPCLQRSIERIEQVLAELFQQHPDAEIFQALPGAGQALAPRLLAVFGCDRGRFQHAREVQQLSGIAPVTERSGKSIRIHRRFACSKFVKQTFHEFAKESIKWSRWARAYYDLQRTRGKGFHAAVRALAFKWIRIIFRCWKDKTIYDEQKYIKALEARRSPLLALLKAA